MVEAGRATEDQQGEDEHLLEQGGWEQPQDGLRYRTFVFNIYGTYVDASLGHFRTKLDFKSLIMETI